ncbi:hypothetical protein [Bacillus sp. FJAT-49736]|uniref:hypothetical protein n=1 Tax=Bacillus sp. FJAT-49736 TaxID=2833582 RepID=UPI001BC9BF47|nr:hypothetical protein [Bacillus sp. FJAT-49736]MBS4171938.1 hypothetical protein [Bacillus sp. FJAT-49736]
MEYKVVNDFIDTNDNNTRYKVGDVYPKGSYKPTKKRIEELSKEHPKYKCNFIEKVEKVPPSE